MRELATTARRLEHRLRRIRATGIYGDIETHRTLWDEFCFECGNGPTAGLESGWDQTLAPLLTAVAERLPVQTAMLLSWHLASLEEEDADDAIRWDLLCEGIRAATVDLASGHA